MIGCRCPAPPVGADGGSWRNGSPSAGLPRQRVSRGVLDLSTLRPRPVLLQPGVPWPSPARAAAPRQLPPPAEPGGAARSSRPPARVPPPVPGASWRDGSGFPFDHLSGQHAGVGSDRDADRRPTSPTQSRCRFRSALSAKPAPPAAALHHLRSRQPFRRSVPTIPPSL